MGKTTVVLSKALVFLWAASAAGFASAANTLEFNTMATVVPPYLGTTNPIRGVPGGGLPWTVSKASGELQSNGKLHVAVEGLVLADSPLVPANLRLTNPIPNFRGVVSCLSKDSLGNPSTVNVSTDNFPADAAGNATIEATVTLPTPCIAPIVFVTSPTDAWFASTGR